MNHRDTETQRRQRQREREGEEGGKQGNPTLLDCFFFFFSLSFCLCLLCVSVSLWFNNLVSMVEFELGTVEQRPEDVGQRLFLIARDAAALDVAEEFVGLL